jgi:hypothetical protein
MAAKKVKVIYQDGRPEEVVKVLPRAQVMTERALEGFRLENVWTANFHLAWAALNTLRKTDLDFETWLNTVEDVEDIEEPVDPTPEVQSADTSSDSASEPDSLSAT